MSTTIGRCSVEGCERFAIQDGRCEDHPPAPAAPTTTPAPALDEETLTELGRLLYGASPGPWVPHRNEDGTWHVLSAAWPDSGYTVAHIPQAEFGKTMPIDAFDAKVIAAARRALPDLIREVRRLRAAALPRGEGLREVLRALVTACPDPAWVLSCALEEECDPPSMIEAAGRGYRDALKAARAALAASEGAKGEP
jgi:hypothetical protein